MTDKDKLEEVVNAKKQVVDGNFVLWRHRFTAISQARGEVEALDLLQDAVEPTADSNGVCPTVSGADCGCPTTIPPGNVTLGEPTVE